MGDLRSVVINNVRVIGMVRGVILMIGFRRVESFQGNDLGDNRPRESFGFFELRHVGLGNSFLLIVAIENHGTVLAAFIWTLAIQLRGVMRNREEDPEKLAVGDLRSVISDFDGLCMAGLAGADEFVLGGLRRAARIS